MTTVLPVDTVVLIKKNVELTVKEKHDLLPLDD